MTKSFFKVKNRVLHPDAGELLLVCLGRGRCYPLLDERRERTGGSERKGGPKLPWDAFASPSCCLVLLSDHSSGTNEPVSVFVPPSPKIRAPLGPVRLSDLFT
jgi:hypothetical protein